MDTATLHVVDDEFVAQLHDVYAPSEYLTPYMLGVSDAQAGKLCIPEMYYTKRGQMLEYAEGHEAVAGVTPLSRQLLRPHAGQRFEQMLRAMMGPDEVEAMLEAQEYEDDMHDREWHSRGMW